MKDIAEKNRMGLVFGVTFVPVVLIVLLVVLSHAVVAETDGALSGEPTSAKSLIGAGEGLAADDDASPDGFVFRFDPESKDFEQFDVSANGANPHSVVVISNATNLDVWFTEPGADQIGRLVYTATNNSALYEYPVPTDSEPLNLAHDQGFVWFTAREGNYIGRLEVASGQVETFTGLAPASRPAGIDVAPDGSVWFTEMAADQIGQLVVTTTSEYDVIEYPIPQFPGLPDESAPYGIAAKGNDEIWFAETVRNQLVRFEPSLYPFSPVGAFAQTGPPQQGGGVLFNLAYSYTDGRLWFTELLGNRVTLFNLTTLSMGLQYDVPTSHSRPYDLVVDSNRQVWFSEQMAGKLGKLVLTSTATFEEYPVPVANAKPQGVTVDPHGKIWFVTSTWQNLYLPLVMQNFPLPTPPFGIQTYWSVDDANGLQQMVDAGTEWLRLPINWNHLEPTDTTPENYNWAMYDTWFRRLHAAGIRPIADIHGNPTWAAQYSAGPIYPERMDDFLEFVGALVERYDGDGVNDALGSPVVNHWEFYNEVDNSSVLLAEAGYGYWGDNGTEYADLLRQAWPVIKMANREAKVLNGGIAYERFRETEGGPYVRKFLDDFLAAGGGQYIDIFNFHYYPNWADRWAPYGQDVIGKTNFLRTKLHSYGVYKPIACTEIGTHSDPSRAGNHELQSRYVVQAFARAMAADLKIVNWFVLRDITEGFPYLYGLLDENYNPKPAYSAFETLTAQLSGARYVRTLSVGETGTTAMEGYVYSKNHQTIYVAWTNDEATYSMGIVASAVEQVDKYGTSEVISDSVDGAADGVVTIDVGPSPLYLRLEP